MRIAGILIVAMAVLLVGCDDGLTDTQEAALITEDGITATQVDGGPWVFTHAPDSVEQALHTGKAEVRDNCLYVDNTVVVWDERDLQYAETLIAEIRTGVAPDVQVPGGGVSIDEGASAVQIPKTIRDRCPTGSVWFAAPLDN